MTDQTIVIPESESSSQLLRAVDEAIAKYTSRLHTRNSETKDIKDLIFQFQSLKDDIDQARNMMFLLIYEKLYIRETTAADEFVTALTDELKPLIKEPAKKETKAP